MKGLVLAEKPSLMRSIREAYQHDSFPFHLDFAAFHGHLMELAEPGDYDPAWAKWTLGTLPMIPDRFRYLPQDRKSISAILQTIKAGQYDFLVNACDAGREGELIFWSFYEANNLKLPVKRLWSSTTVEKDLKQALHNLRPASDFDNLRASSRFRAEFDWLVGMNFSRAISLKTNKTSNIGRVVTPTLKMVVDRELEIQNFVSQPFWEVEVPMEKDRLTFPGTALVPPELKQTRFPDRTAAERTLKTIGREGTVENVTTKRRSTPAPTLYSTLTLQKDASRYFRFRSSRTDDLAQELYEMGFISYPRTECRYLPTSLVGDIPQLLQSVAKLPALAQEAQAVTAADIKKATSGKRYVDDSKLTDHHAIIPTTANLDPNRLNADQRKLYELVCKRFLSIFLPPYVVDNTTAIIDSNGVKLKATGRTIIQKGFSVLYNDTSKDVPLPAMKRGDKVAIGEGKIKEGKTTPPDRYTEETLLDAMANAGRFVSAAEQRAILKETAGLGTGATRSGILKKLEDTGMCRVEKKTYIPTEFGMQLIAVIGDRDISSPSMTAQWEARLRDLEEHGHPDVFKDAMLEYIRVATADLVTNIQGNLGIADGKPFGKCPLCGGTVLATPTDFQCERTRDGASPCTFSLRRKALGVNITDTDMKALLEGRPTRAKRLKFPNGKSLTAPLVLSPTGKITVGGERKKAEDEALPEPGSQEPICFCPLCGKGQILRGSSHYLCTGKENGCVFSLGTTLLGTEITPEDVRAICTGDTTQMKTFTWKSGKQGQAQLKLGARKKKGESGLPLEFVFPEKPAGGTGGRTGGSGRRTSAAAQSSTSSARARQSGSSSGGGFAGESADDRPPWDEGVTPSFTGNSPEEGICACPLCGRGRIHLDGNRYTCSGKINGCRFALGATLLGTEITEEDVKAICTGGLTQEKTFTWKSGKQGQARLKMGTKKKGDNGLPLEFVFPDRSSGQRGSTRPPVPNAAQSQTARSPYAPSQGAAPPVRGGTGDPLEGKYNDLPAALKSKGPLHDAGALASLYESEPPAPDYDDGSLDTLYGSEPPEPEYDPGAMDSLYGSEPPEPEYDSGAWDSLYGSEPPEPEYDSGALDALLGSEPPDSRYGGGFQEPPYGMEPPEDLTPPWEEPPAPAARQRTSSRQAPAPKPVPAAGQGSAPWQPAAKQVPTAGQGYAPWQTPTPKPASSARQEPAPWQPAAKQTTTTGQGPAPWQTPTAKSSPAPQAGICACPLCKDGMIRRDGNRYVCSGRNTGCRFSLGATLLGTEITEEDVGAICAGEITQEKTFTWKSGRQGQARLKMGRQTKGDSGLPLEFVFDNGPRTGASTTRRPAAQTANAPDRGGKTWEEQPLRDTVPQASLCTCPLCKTGQIRRDGNRYVCSGKSAGCGFSLGATLLGTEITEDDVRAICAGQLTGLKTFTWRSGKQGQAQLKMGRPKKGDSGLPLEFVFPDRGGRRWNS